MNWGATLKKYAPLLLIVIASVSTWLLGLHHYLSIDSLKTHQQDLEMFTAQHFALSLLIYSGIYVAVVTLSLPVAALMTLAGGFLFGQGLGTVGAVISATLGASLLFLSTKMASNDVLKSKEATWVKTMKKGFQDNAFFYLLTLRLIPIFPFVAVNLVAALLQIPLRTFFLGTLIGIIPGSFVYVSLGVALREVIHQPSPNLIVSPKILIAFAGLGILSLLPVLYKWYHPNSLDKNQDPQNQ